VVAVDEQLTEEIAAGVLAAADWSTPEADERATLGTLEMLRRAVGADEGERRDARGTGAGWRWE
jgi:hypothetical protein